jgi:hypothetical protein
MWPSTRFMQNDIKYHNWYYIHDYPNKIKADIVEIAIRDVVDPSRVAGETPVESNDIEQVRE